MPVHITPASKFTIAFLRGNEVLDARLAPTGERALKVAILMLAELDDLQNGDRLTVTEA